mgnify:CR=1 FL=1
MQSKTQHYFKIIVDLCVIKGIIEDTDLLNFRHQLLYLCQVIDMQLIQVGIGSRCCFIESGSSQTIKPVSVRMEVIEMCLPP